MNSLVSEQTPPTTDNDRKWPESLRDEPHVEKFPYRLLLTWLIPGAVGLAILLVIFGLLNRQANRQIVFLSAEEALTAVNADMAETREILDPAQTVVGVPRWSSNGRYLATTVLSDTQTHVAIFPSDLTTPTFVTALLTPTMVTDTAGQTWTLRAASDGWSTKGRYLAIVGELEEQSYLSIYDVETQQHLLAPLAIDTRAGLSWSPRQEALLFTAYGDDIPAPKLYIVDTQANNTPFSPDDGQLMHADGRWSPNGRQITYIASNTYTDTQDILWGSVWIAEQDGSNARRITKSDQNIAPFWGPKGDYLYYTRFNTVIGHFELYRIAVTGASPAEEYVGPGTESQFVIPFERNLLAQWSPNNNHLLFLGQGKQLPHYYKSLQPSIDSREQIQTSLPVQAAYHWSPDGNWFAGTSLESGQISISVFNSTDNSIFFSPETPNWMIMPGDGWSPDSAYVALLRYDGATTRLAALNVANRTVGTADFDLDVRAGLNWHPNSTQILATATDGGLTTSLKIYDVSANTWLDFIPEDEQILHADGVWSPDGNMVAYITRDTMTDTLGLDFLAGALWVASSDGRFAQQLVAEGLNLAPIWMDSEHILFTRFTQETGAFELFQVDLRGSVEWLGLSSAEFARFPFDRQRLMRWSPDGRLWLLPGAKDAGPFTLYQADRKSNEVAAFPQQCPTGVMPIARWAPTNRAVLVACPSRPMILHWIDADRPDTVYPAGTFPTWQP